MSTIMSKDGTQIYFKDWGPRTAQAIVNHHRWPLSADDWDAQMLVFVAVSPSWCSSAPCRRSW